MKALSTPALALAMASAATQQAQPFSNLLPRDTANLDQMAIQLRDRISQLDTLLERYRDRLSALDGLPEDLKTELENRSKEVARLTGEIEEIQQQLVDGVHDRSRGEQDTIAAALIRNKDAVEFAKTMAARSGQKKESVVFDGINARNVITLAGLGTNGSLAKNDVSRTSFQAPLSVIDLINWGSADGDVAIFLRESAFEILADIAPENTDKKESNLLFGPVQLNIGTIAHWIRASKQVLADMTWLANYIETRMTYGVRLKLEYFVVNGHTPTAGNPKCFSGLLETGNFVTITPEADATAIDVLNQAKYKAADSHLLSDSMVLNPEDWGKIERIKGTDGHYIFGAPGAAVQPVLWGVPVVFAASMPKGKYWVGNLAIGFDGQIREDVAVTVSTEDGSNVTKNLVTILAEMRAAGAVVLPDACVSGDLPAIVADPVAP